MYSRDFSWFRLLVVIPALLLIFLSQFYWFTRAWRLSGRIKQAFPRVFLRGCCAVTFGLLALALYLNFSFSARRGLLEWRSARVLALTGLWLSSALFAYLAIQIVALAAWLWGLARRAVAAMKRGPSPAALPEIINLERRKFVHGASVVAGSLPFAAGLYGFAFERLRFQVHNVELPVANLPAALNGMRIAQLSDIHIGSYMSAAEVRRAVDMANALGADLTVVTGDFITGAGDPLEACIAELSRLRAPLGVWGCNGNHEIYAGVEAEAAELFGHYGMRLLRQENEMLVWRGQPLNLIGVDYEVTRDARGNRRSMLAEVEPLVRHDMPNILLSHNPNTFRRSAELGIELMLTGHTHGGQVKVEILDDRFSPARFLTSYIAGLYRRPLGSSSRLSDEDAWAGAGAGSGGAGAALVYVNRGLGTVGMPVRLGVPPEITLHRLSRA